MISLVSPKSSSRVLAILAAIAGLTFAAGCGSSSNNVSTNPQGFSKSNFNGTYVISVTGTDVNPTADTEAYFAITGTINADGNGNITGGTLDINDLDLASPGVFKAVSVSTSTYSVTQDGRGKLTLPTPEGTFGFDFVLTSDSHGLITRYDSDGSGSGTLDIQGSATQTSLTSLAFSLSGADYNSASDSDPLPGLATAGAVTLNGSGTVTAGVEDINDNGSSAQTGLTGLPITSGSIAISSGTSGTASFTTTSTLGTLSFDVWVIDATHLKLIETDTATTGYALAGDVFTQQTSITAGQLVFTVAGQDTALTPFVAGGYATTDTSGNLTVGLEDYNDGGTVVTARGFTAAATTSVGAAGRVQLTTTGLSNGTSSNLAFAAYPSSGGILLLEDDSAGLAQGAAYAQTATTFNAAGYGMNLTGSNSNGEVDDIVQATATTATTDNFNGVVDENDLADELNYDVGFNGTYTPDSTSDGRGSILIPTNNSIATFIGGLTLQYYVVDASTVLVIEVDSSQGAAGMFEVQSSPSSQPATQSHIALARALAKSHGARAVRLNHK